MLLVFTSVVAYLMDTYQTYTASAIGASVVLRSLLGAFFPLFTAGLFKRVGNEWGASLFAFLALICLPLPFLFYVSFSVLLVELNTDYSTVFWSKSAYELESCEKVCDCTYARGSGSDECVNKQTCIITNWLELDKLVLHIIPKLKK